MLENKQDNLNFVAPINLDEIKDIEGKKSSTVEILREGLVQDRGLRITGKMLSDYVTNFNEGVYGNKIAVNYGHDRKGKAAGWINKLFISGKSLMAEIEWTPVGEQMLHDKEFQFVSSELAFKHPHADTGKAVSNVLIGVALTNVPAVKRQQPIALSETEEKIINQHVMMFKELIADLTARETLTKADVDFVKKQAALTENAELAEEMKTEIAALCSKQELAEKTAADKKKAADDKKKKDEADAEDEDETLTEKDKEIAALSEKVKALETEQDRNNLSEDVRENLLLDESEGLSVGFADADLDEVVGFMAKLDEEGRTAFKTLVSKVKSVDFAVRGGKNESGVVGATTEDKVVALAEELMSKDSKLDARDAQKQAMKKLGVVRL